MKKLIATTLIAATITLAAAPAHAHDGNDLLIVNNGDGSDFLYSIRSWFNWLRIG